MTQTITPDRCPECAGTPASAPGHPVWCAACEWGLAAPPAPRRGARGRFERWSSIAVLRGLASAEPALLLEPDEEQRIRGELAGDYSLIARRLRDDARERLH